MRARGLVFRFVPLTFGMRQADEKEGTLDNGHQPDLLEVSGSHGHPVPLHSGKQPCWQLGKDIV
eukprot:12916062-Prorocentrum_lima.AAC.1